MTKDEFQNMHIMFSEPVNSLRKLREKNNEDMLYRYLIFF